MVKSDHFSLGINLICQYLCNHLKIESKVNLINKSHSVLRTTRFTKQFFFLLRSLSSPALTSEEVLHINACAMLIFVVPVDHVLRLCWHSTTTVTR